MANAKVSLLSAYTLAKAKHYAEAEELLLSDNDVAKTPEALDLLARIRMEQGDTVSAKRLWQDVLAIQPNHTSAKRALARIQHPYSLRPSARTLYGILIFLACMVILLATAIGFLKQPAPLPQTTTTLLWAGPPTFDDLEALVPYQGRVNRLQISSRIFARNNVSRKQITNLLCERLHLTEESVFIATSVGDAIVLEFDLKAK